VTVKRGTPFFPKSQVSEKAFWTQKDIMVAMTRKRPVVEMIVSLEKFGSLPSKGKRYLE
jgi:hypothetical protein